MFDGNRPSARLIGGALVGVMVLGSALGAEAATKKKAVKKPVKVTRTVTLKYTGGCSIETPAVVGSLTSSCGQFGAAGWDVASKATEKYATITVKDASGRGVPGAFWEGTGTTSTTSDFCGALKNYAVPAGGSVRLALDAVGGRQSCPGTATQGTITIVFSNLP